MQDFPACRSFHQLKIGKKENSQQYLPLAGIISKKAKTFRAFRMKRKVNAEFPVGRKGFHAGIEEHNADRKATIQFV